MFYEKHHNTRLLMVDIFCLSYIVLVRLLSLVLFHICSRAPVIAMMLAHGSSEMNELAALLLRVSARAPSGRPWTHPPPGRGSSSSRTSAACHHLKYQTLFIYILFYSLF